MIIAVPENTAKLYQNDKQIIFILTSTQINHLPGYK